MIFATRGSRYICAFFFHVLTLVSRNAAARRAMLDAVIARDSKPGLFNARTRLFVIWRSPSPDSLIAFHCCRRRRHRRRRQAVKNCPQASTFYTLYSFRSSLTTFDHNETIFCCRFPTSFRLCHVGGISSRRECCCFERQVFTRAQQVPCK